jgi:hypothetical protein
LGFWLDHHSLWPHKLPVIDSDKTLIAGGIKIAGSLVLTGVNPALLIPWEMVFCLYGAVVERRKDKAQEWLSMFSENRHAFMDAIVENPQFQDAFVNSFEKYLRERNYAKRRLMLSTFLGFTITEDKEAFPIERHYLVIESISTFALSQLAHIEKMESKNTEAFFQPYNGSARSVTKFEEVLFELASLNILLADPTPRAGPIFEPFVRFTQFGRSFVRFLKGHSLQ